MQGTHREGDFSHRALLGLFSLVAGLRLPLALGRRGLGIGWSGAGEGRVQMAPES